MSYSIVEICRSLPSQARNLVVTQSNSKQSAMARLHEIRPGNRLEMFQCFHGPRVGEGGPRD
jgi:hypothetical protein